MMIVEKVTTRVKKVTMTAVTVKRVKKVAMTARERVNVHTCLSGTRRVMSP